MGKRFYIEQDHTGAPAVITLAEAKKHLHLEADFTEEDDLIQIYIDAAVAAAEGFTGSHIKEKIYLMISPELEDGMIFAESPVQEITHVKYHPADGSGQVTVDPDDYDLLPLNQVQQILSLASDLAVPSLEDRKDAAEILMTVGYGAGDLPADIKSAVMLILRDLYDNREDRSRVLRSASENLLRRYKKY